MQHEEGQKASIIGLTFALLQSLERYWKISYRSSWRLSQCCCHSLGAGKTMGEEAMLACKVMLELAFSYGRSQGHPSLFRLWVTWRGHPTTTFIQNSGNWTSFRGLQSKKFYIFGWCVQVSHTYFRWKKIVIFQKHSRTFLFCCHGA